jgi:fatty acid desaturase
VPGGWAATQIATTADFCHGSRFWLHVVRAAAKAWRALALMPVASLRRVQSGGLNYQVVHHLFPGVCHCHYPALAPIVLRTAAEFGIPYKVYPTFLSAVGGHFRQLAACGRRPGIPSLHTVG